LMVYLPKEKLLVEADVFTPPPPNTPLSGTPNPNTVNLADNITRLKLTVDQILPLHGRIVPMADLNRAIGRAQHLLRRADRPAAPRPGPLTPSRASRAAIPPDAGSSTRPARRRRGSAGLPPAARRSGTGSRPWRTGSPPGGRATQRSRGGRRGCCHC